MMGGSRRRALAALCVTEITSYGVIYYAFPVLATQITAGTGWSRAAITAAYSAGNLAGALTGILAGRLLHRYGPRPVMTTASVLGALTGWYGPRRVQALTTLTLAAGFASTIFAPLTSALAGQLSWREVYLVLAAILAVITIPAHAVALRLPWREQADQEPAPVRDRQVLTSRAFLQLTAAGTLCSFAQYAVLVNLVPLLEARGMAPTLAAVTLGLGGVGQVAGRLCYRILTTPGCPARIGYGFRTGCADAEPAARPGRLARLYHSWVPQPASRCARPGQPEIFPGRGQVPGTGTDHRYGQCRPLTVPSSHCSRGRCDACQSRSSHLNDAWRRPIRWRRSSPRPGWSGWWGSGSGRCHRGSRPLGRHRG
jgi:MFS family permease